MRASISTIIQPFIPYGRKVTSSVRASTTSTIHCPHHPHHPHHPMSKATAGIMKECQVTIAFALSDIIYQGGDSRNKQDLRKKMHEGYHGDGSSNTVSMVKQFFHGQGPFEMLFEKDTLTSNAAGNDGSSTVQLTIPSKYTRRVDLTIQMGTSLTLNALSSSTMSGKFKLNGVTLWNQSNKALMNCKKALAISTKYVNSDSQLPSGSSIEDYIEHILSEMWLSVGLKKSTGEDSDNDDHDDEVPGDVPRSRNNRPTAWFFSGFWAFMLFGPLADTDVRSTLLVIGDISAVGRGRKNKRSDNEEAKRKVRSASDNRNFGPFERGMSYDERIRVAALSEQVRSALARDEADTAYGFEARGVRLTDEMKALIEVAKILGVDSNGKPDPHNEFWVDVKEHRKIMKEADQEVRAFTAKKARRIELSGPSVSEIFIESVRLTPAYAGVAPPCPQRDVPTPVAPAPPANRPLLTASPTWMDESPAEMDESPAEMEDQELSD